MRDCHKEKITKGLPCTTIVISCKLLISTPDVLPCSNCSATQFTVNEIYTFTFIGKFFNLPNINW